MDLEKRVTNLENLVASLIKRINNDKFYDDADKVGIRHVEAENNGARQIETSENEQAIFELAELISEMEGE